MDLKTLEPFAIFSDMSRETLQTIARTAEVRSFDAGATVFEEGQAATELYGLLEGQVTLSLILEDRVLKPEVRYEEYVHKQVEVIEKEMIFETIPSGEVFAWSALIAPHQLTATARCTRPSRLAVIPTQALEAVFAKEPSTAALFMRRLAEVIAQRLRHRTDKLIESWYEAFGENHL